MELSGLYLMSILGVFLLLDGLRRIVVQGFSKSVWQVLGCVAIIAACFALPIALDGMGGFFHILALVMSVAGILLVAAFIVFTVLCMAWSNKPLPPVYDYIVVLGAGLREGVRPTRLLAGRLRIAAALFNQQHGLSYVVVCGGQGSDEQVSEAQAMSVYLQDLGVPQDCILMEGQSTTTMENLLFASRLVNQEEDNQHALKVLDQLPRNFGFQRAFQVRSLNAQIEQAGEELPTIVIVTSNFHIVRTKLHALMVPGVEVTGYVGKGTQWYYLPAALMRDFLSMGSHVLRLLLKRES